MTKYEENSVINTKSKIYGANCTDKNSSSYFTYSNNTLNGMYLDVESKYFANQKIIFGTNSTCMMQCPYLDRAFKNEIWLTLPLVFPVATIHNVTHHRENQFSESKGGSLCFSPEETNISRLFSTIQGLSDIGAGFFQIVIAKIKGIVSEDIEVIKNEFGKVFKDQDLSINGLISLKPIGWRKRNFSKVSSTIPIQDDETIVDALFKKQNSYFNAILISENYSENCKENIAKLGKLSNSFLEKIKFIYPSLEIVKVSDLEKDNFFEVTIRVNPMPSYISSDGEDFESKDKKFSLFRNSPEMSNFASILIGDIRLINPYKTEEDKRIPFGSLETFSLISNHSIFEQFGYCMATYVPIPLDRKKKYYQMSSENATEQSNNGSKPTNSSQIFDRIQYKLSTPKLLTFGDKEINIKTPPPNNFFTNSNCVSNISTCDLGYNTLLNSNWGRKSYSCTPTTKASINKTSYTPFSSDEIDTSQWLSTDLNIDSASMFSFDQDNQQFIPPRISSLNYISNLCNGETKNNSNKKFLHSNLISERSVSNISINNFGQNCLEVVQESSNKNEVSEFVFGIEHNFDKSQTIEFDDQIELLEYDCHQYFENKDFDIINMLENIFSDNSTTNLENCHIFCNTNYSDLENVKSNSQFIEAKFNRPLNKNYNKNFGLWSFELQNNLSTCIEKLNSNAQHKGENSEFVPNELNYLNEHTPFNQ